MRRVWYVRSTLTDDYRLKAVCPGHVIQSVNLNCVDQTIAMNIPFELTRNETLEEKEEEIASRTDAALLVKLLHVIAGIVGLRVEYGCSL